MDRLGATVPVIDAAACVHTLAPVASCRACVEACPHAAMVLTDEALGIDVEACTGCGRCVPACPRSAITAERDMLVIRTGRDSGEAFAACRRAVQPDVAAMACVHALGARDLDTLAADGIARLSVATGACETCTDGVGPVRLDQAAKTHAAVRASRGERAVAVVRSDPASFRRTLARARESEQRIDRSRRRLFGAIIDVPPPAAATPMPRAYVTPTIDAAQCTACEACIRICPDDALALERGGRHRFRVQPDRCSGCGLCVDVCEDGAMGLVPLGDAKAADVPLDGYRCRACGVTVHVPAGRDTTSLCRICARTGHYRSLFQVLDP